MNKIKYIILLVVCLFMFSGNIDALSIKADGKKHEFTAEALGGRGQVKSCSTNNGSISATVENGKCIVQSNGTIGENVEITINYEWVYSGHGGTGSASATVTKTVEKVDRSKDKVADAPSDSSSSGSLDICKNNPNVMKFMKLGSVLIIVVKIIVPIMLILFGMIDMSKAVIDSNQDAIQKNAITFTKRAALGILVFLAPNIILGLFDTIDKWNKTSSDFAPCIKCLFNIKNCP